MIRWKISQIAVSKSNVFGLNNLFIIVLILFNLDAKLEPDVNEDEDDDQP